MRAIAVLVVLANHLFDWPPGGFVGVDVFFVLSGFFITGLLIRERTDTGRLSFQDFYVRRVRRILPSAVLVLIVTVIGSYVLFTASRAKDTFLDALYAALFGANFRFEAVGADYFQQSLPPSPLQHYWSLSIEEQFYFVWPALLATIFVLTRRLARRGKRSARQWGLFGAMSLVVAASFGWAMFLSADDPNRAYFSSLTRVWELGVGALVAIAGPWLVRIPSSVRPLLAYLGLTGVVTSLFLINSAVRWPAPWAALPILSTALVVCSFHGSEVRGMFPLTNPVARYFGDTSYTLYLWHWPVIILLLAVMPRNALFYGIALALSLGLTAVTYRFYENPIRQSDWLDGESVHSANRRRRIPTLSRAAWGFVGALIASAIFTQILVIRSGTESPQAEDAYQSSYVATEQSAPKSDPCFGAPAMVTPGCTLRDPRVPLSPSIDQFATDHQGSIACLRQNLRPNPDERLQQCKYGYPGNDATRIALVGDSHAAALLPALWPILNSNKWQITTYFGRACEFMSPAAPLCEDADIEKQLLAEHYDLVITTSYRDREAAYQVTPDRYKEAWAAVAAAGTRIAVVADNPRVTEDALACLTRVNLGGADRTGDCSMPRAEALSPPDSLITAASLVPNATLIDLTPYFCTTDRCPMVIGNVIVYRDAGSHLTATFARTLAPAIQDGLQRALGAPPTNPSPAPPH